MEPWLAGKCYLVLLSEGNEPASQAGSEGSEPSGQEQGASSPRNQLWETNPVLVSSSLELDCG